MSEMSEKERHELLKDFKGVTYHEKMRERERTDKREDYKYNEGNYLEDIKNYIDSTYNQHYSTNNFQATEFIIDGGHGTGFCIGNVMKYAQRYGKKNGYNVNDLMKIIHYAIIQLYVHEHDKLGEIK